MYKKIKGDFMLFKTIPTLLISPNLYSVCTKYVNFYIYKDDKFAICFDTGFGISKVEKELQKIQISPEEITHIFLTHSDRDHVEGIKLFSKAKVYVSKLEVPLMNGEIKRSPLTKNPKLECDYVELSDEEIITIGSLKIKAISTPGHTIGSMSYLLNDNILFAGDAFVLKKDKAIAGSKFLSMNRKIQNESIMKLSKLENISLVCTCHTGISKNFDSIMKDWKI